MLHNIFKQLKKETMLSRSFHKARDTLKQKPDKDTPGLVPRLPITEKNVLIYPRAKQIISTISIDIC